MTINRPRSAQLRATAESLEISMTDAEVSSYLTLMDGNCVDPKYSVGAAISKKYLAPV
jgi:hypothetical protein